MSEGVQRFFTNRHLQQHKDNALEKNLDKFSPDVKKAILDRQAKRKGLQGYWNDQRNFANKERWALIKPLPRQKRGPYGDGVVSILFDTEEEANKYFDENGGDEKGWGVESVSDILKHVKVKSVSLGTIV